MSNATVRLEYHPVSDAAYPIQVTAHVEELGAPTNATGNVTLRIDGTGGGAEWLPDVETNMTQIGTGLYRYEWTPQRLGTFNILANGTTLNGTFQASSPVDAKQEGVFETNMSIVEIPGYDSSWSFFIVLLAALIIWGMFREWWSVVITASMGFLSAVLVPHLPVEDVVYLLDVLAILLLVMASFGLDLFLTNRRAQRLEKESP